MRFGNFLSATSHMVLTQGFSPIKLSNLTAWYDPSDLNTLFQDSTGTTPVTSPGQPVGLVLDKSRGLVRGAEKVVNGGFDADATWIKGTGWTISVGKARSAGGNNLSDLTQSLAASAGTTYEVRFTVSEYVSGVLRARFTGGGESYAVDVTANGTYRMFITPAAARTTFGFLALGGSGFNGAVDDVSVRELPGSHLNQATAAKRPEYGIMPKGGVRNLLTYSEDFSNGVWVKVRSSVTPNANVAPDGTNTADKFVEDATAGNSHTIQQAPSMALNTTHTFSVYAKAAERSFIVLNVFSGTTSYWTWFDLASGVVSGSTNSPIYSIESVGDGWYRCRLTVTTAASGTPNATIWVTTGSGVINYTGDGSSGVYLWGAQLETGSTPTAYQKVVSAREVTEAGQPSLSYLYFDGVDDALATAGNVDLTGTDAVSVFAGVRKESDAAVGMIAELSAASTSNNSTFALYSSASPGYASRHKGTLSADPSVGGIASPHTAVLMTQGDISSDVALLRLNGAQVASSALDQGTGNYGSYPLYIGARGGTSLYFKGNLCGIILRSVISSDNTVSQVERWLAQKTGVTI